MSMICMHLHCIFPKVAHREEVAIPFYTFLRRLKASVQLATSIHQHKKRYLMKKLLLLMFLAAPIHTCHGQLLIDVFSGLLILDAPPSQKKSFTIYTWADLVKSQNYTE